MNERDPNRRDEDMPTQGERPRGMGRGPVTRAVTWVILVVFGLIVLAMIVVMVLDF